MTSSARPTPAPGRVTAHPDEGRAIVEFIFLGVLLLLPLVYLVLTAARLQAASFSASLGRARGRPCLRHGRLRR